MCFVVAEEEIEINLQASSDMKDSEKSMDLRE
jgi:hypothetical protein